jgi:hypothetical protein
VGEETRGGEEGGVEQGERKEGMLRLTRCWWLLSAAAAAAAVLVPVSLCYVRVCKYQRMR